MKTTSKQRRRFLTGASAALAGAAVGRVAWAQQDPIKIALTAPLSGPAQSVGEPLLIGAQVAAAQANRAGGVLGRQIEIVPFDDKANPTQTAAVVREMAGQKINLIVGPPLTANGMAAYPLLTEYNMIMTITGSADERFTHENFMRNVFQASPNNYITSRSYTKVLAQRYPDVTVWTAALTDLSAQLTIWNVFSTMLTRAYAEAGRKITLLDPIVAKLGTPDFRPQLSGLMDSQATGLMNAMFGSDGVTFFQQARQFGLDKKIKVFADYSMALDLPLALKRNLPANVMSKVYYPLTLGDDPLLLELHKAFGAKSGSPVAHPLCIISHNAVQAYVEAMRAARSTETPKVIEALETIKIKSIRGPIHYRKEDHQMLASLSYVKFVPRDAEPGWAAVDAVTTPDEPNAPLPTPGVALKL